MTDTSTRRARLQKLLDLAMIYRGWTRKELAAALGRDPTKLIPSTGNPKLDLLVELADVLEWPVGDVTECLWGGLEVLEAPTQDSESFDALYKEGQQAHRDGRHRELVRIGMAAAQAATTPTQRALAQNRICGGWEGLGRYVRSMEAARTGLREHPIEPEVRRMLHSNLANAAYALWNLTEARSAAADLLDQFRAMGALSARDRRTAAFTLYVKGSTHRRLIDLEPERAQHHAAAGRSLLKEAEQSLRQCAPACDDRLEGIARTCRGAVLEVDVVLGRKDAHGALAIIIDALSEIIDLNDVQCGDLIESHGWWCIFGCNIALRHLSDSGERHRMLGLLSNKAIDIADRLNNWSMRERIFSLQYCNAQDKGDHQEPMIIDAEDAKLITGTMGRFPQFRNIGWALLRNAGVPVGT
jgi:tetratricopeptide (TPR) repeat protein